MEESLVKLRLAELAKIRNKAEVKENMPPINGTNQKDGKYYLVRLEMEKEKLNALIDASERDARLLDLPEEGEKLFIENCVVLLFFIYVGNSCVGNGKD